MRKIIIFTFTNMICMAGFTQTMNIDSLHAKMDSSLRAIMHADSLKIIKEYAETEHWGKLKAIEQFPAINAGEHSGVVPVNDVTEVPDPKLEYKMLFEVTYGTPDSIAGKPNYALVDIARTINLHVAAGIPENKIIPVIVVHAAALDAISNNAHYREHYHMDNPNRKLISDLEKAGAKFIACGQAMAFLSIRKEDLLPEVKVALSAQPILTSYQLKGYVWRKVDID